MEMKIIDFGRPWRSLTTSMAYGRLS